MFMVIGVIVAGVIGMKAYDKFFGIEDERAMYMTGDRYGW